MKVKEIFCELELKNLPQTRLYTGGFPELYSFPSC